MKRTAGKVLSWSLWCTVSLFGLSCSGGGEGRQDAGDDGNGVDAADAAGDAADGTADAADDFADGTDAGGEGLCRFDPQVEWFLLGEILQMESQDKQTCVWLQRKNLCPEGWICKAVPFQLQAIRIGHQGRLVETNETAQLTWTSSWHNWEDVGEARIEGTTYRLQGTGFGQEYDLSASGTENWGPLRMLPYRP